MSLRRRVFQMLSATLVAAGLASAGSLAQAADFPTKPMRMIIPFATGGAATILTEHIVKEMEAELGQPIVRDYRGGASGTIAMQLAASAPDDGYTMLVVSNSQAIAVGVYTNLKFDLAKDFAGVTLLASTPYVLVVSGSLPVQNVQQLVAYGKSNPGKLVAGLSGAGGVDDISSQEFARVAGINMLRVPYRGAGPVIPDLLAGRVNVTFLSPLPTKQFVEQGKLKLLGVTTKQRSSAMPNVPSIAEQGLPDFDISGWYGLVVPRGTPPAVVATLQRATAAALAKPAVKEFMATNGLTPGGSSASDFTMFLASEITRWTKLATSMGIKPQ